MSNAAAVRLVWIGKLTALPYILTFKCAVGPSTLVGVGNFLCSCSFVKAPVRKLKLQ
jgi:hypothetical protein